MPNNQIIGKLANEMMPVRSETYRITCNSAVLKLVDVSFIHPRTCNQVNLLQVYRYDSISNHTQHDVHHEEDQHGDGLYHRRNGTPANLLSTPCPKGGRDRDDVD